MLIYYNIKFFLDYNIIYILCLKKSKKLQTLFAVKKSIKLFNNLYDS